MHVRCATDLESSDARCAREVDRCVTRAFALMSNSARNATEPGKPLAVGFTRDGVYLEEVAIPLFFRP